MRLLTRPMLLLLSIVLLAGCGKEPTSFVYTGDEGPALIRWTRDGDKLKGVLHNTNRDGFDSSSQQLDFTGTLKDEDLTLDFDGNTLQGTFDGDKVKLEIPNDDGDLEDVTLSPGSKSDYNKARTRFQKMLDKERTQAAEDEAAAEAREQADTIAADLNEAVDLLAGADSFATEGDFDTPVKDAKTALASARSIHAALAPDEEFDCETDVFGIEGEVTTLEGALNSWDSSRFTLDYELGEYTEAIKNTGILRAQLDTELEKVDYDPSVPSQSEVDDAIAEARTMIKAQNAAAARSKEQIEAMLTEGRALVTKGEKVCA